MDEFDLIDRLIAPLATTPGADGLADDGATVTASPGMTLAVTKDLLAEGVHFLADDPPDPVARKLLRANLSDLAAMGAKPLGYLLGLSSDGKRGETWYRSFFDGLRADQEHFGVSILGGDTIASRHGVLTLSLTAFGEVPEGLSLARSRGRPGDLVAVSGTIGDAALGLLARRGRLAGRTERDLAYLRDRYLLPRPRVALGREILGVAHAALDVSDGLVADAGQLARRSGVGVELRLDAIPLSPAARRAVGDGIGGLETFLDGGDDYELLFSFAPSRRERILEASERSGTPVAIIGRCHEGEGARIVDREGAVANVASRGWRHRP